MKKFTLVAAAMALLVNVGYAQAPKLKQVKSLDAVELKEVSGVELKKLPSLNVERERASRFDFVKASQKRTMQKPAKTSALAAPVALEATNVNDYYFVANWNAVSGANYYETDVYRSFEVGADSATFEALYEDFLFAEPQNQLVSGYLDDYTYRWDWYLSYGKVGDQSVIFPATTTAGYTELDTPNLDLSGGVGPVYFAISATGTIGDKIGIGYWYYEDGADKETVLSLGTISFASTSIGAWYSANLPVSDGAGFFLYTESSMGNKGDVTLNAFRVAQDFAPYTEFFGFHDYVMTPGTSAQFFTMEKDPEMTDAVDEFVYVVFALNVNMATGSIVDASDMSNMIIVGEGGGTAVEGLKAHSDKVFVHDNLHVSLEQPTTVYVYNLAGALVGSFEGVAGDNEFALPAAGAYVVKAGNVVAKVMK